MGVSIWEGQKASDLIDAVRSGRNEIGITQNFADALLAVFNNVAFDNANGAIALNNLREVMDAILSGGFVSMTEYYVLRNYGPAVLDMPYYGCIPNNSRALLVSEQKDIKIPAKSSTSLTTYDTEIPYSFVKIPAGATQMKQINTGGYYFNTRPLVYDGEHFVTPTGTDVTFQTRSNVYSDISAYNNGQHYLQMFYTASATDGTAAAVIFR